MKPASLISSITFVYLSLHPLHSRAQSDDQYYREVRKLKKMDSASLEKAKQSTIEAERVRKANALSRENFQHNSTVDSQSQKELPANTAEGSAPAFGPQGQKAGTPKMRPGSKSATVTATASPRDSSGTENGYIRTAPSKKASGTSSDSIKVNSDTPDELVFPGK